MQSTSLSEKSLPQLGLSGKYLEIVAELPAQWSGVGALTLGICTCLIGGVCEDLDFGHNQLLGSLNRNLSELHTLKNFFLACSLLLLLLALLSSNLESLSSAGVTGASSTLTTSSTNLSKGIPLFLEAHSWGL